MLTVRKLRYFTSAAAASLVLVAATGDNFSGQVSSTSKFVRTAQVTNGGVIGGGGNGGVNNSGGVIRGSVIGGGTNGGVSGRWRTNSPGGPTHKPR